MSKDKTNRNILISTVLGMITSAIAAGLGVFGIMWMVMTVKVNEAREQAVYPYKLANRALICKYTTWSKKHNKAFHSDSSKTGSKNK